MNTKKQTATVTPIQKPPSPISTATIVPRAIAKAHMNSVIAATPSLAKLSRSHIGIASQSCFTRRA